MSIKVVLAKTGMGIEEGTIVAWLKSEGDRVARGEVIVEVETAKTTQEVEAPADGVLAQILVGVGETVPVNSELAVIEPSDG